MEQQNQNWLVPHEKARIALLKMLKQTHEADPDGGHWSDEDELELSDLLNQEEAE